MKRLSTRPPLILFIVLCIPFFGVSQVSLDNLIGNLKQTPFNGILSGKSYTTKIIKIPQELRCGESKHNYLWYRNKLVVQIDGSGYLYEYNSDQQLKRIDSTCYEGYNFGAFPFVYKDTLFSLGGYGFWQFNGMLRYFNDKTGEWEVVETNKAIPLMIQLYSKPYYDIANQKIYLIYKKPRNPSADDSYKIDKTLYVQCFDIPSKKWWNEDRIFNEKINSEIFSYLSPGAFHTKYGLIHGSENDVFLYDFANNKVNIVVTEKAAQIFGRGTTKTDNIFYSKDSSLFFFDLKSGLIDSVSFGSHDFVDTGIPLFNSINKSEKLITNPYPIAIILLTVLSVLIFVILLIRNKRLKQRVEFLMSSHLVNGKKGNGEITVANPESFRENLTEVEKGLLDILVANSLVDTMTTVSQVNQVLGISNKALKIQNNIRAATILLINKKFMIYSGSADELIEKQRTDFDKRFFEYSIQRKYLNKVK